MLKKYIRSTIIVMIQVILPVLLLLMIAPQLLQFSHEFNQASNFFITHKIGFLIIHIIFYLALFGLWRRIIYFYVKRSNIEITAEQVQTALKAKWYLLVAMAFFELMVWWK
ncbi:TPA: hypothetical protein F7136_04720 [Legionella pneumophila]|uniref:Uncharacterized protein n=1 Tax=Legionella waltersii TaxID=66969 RepID=A0A0W1A0K9_9GAMM|nr:hypothetical protein [Legionella waltersii]HAU3626743.1 hypothetical protein [Legionella pneumophila]KTD74858.1 hypothetical protein Lwal_2899 [Legionella waltersii]SNV11884.1 Uncharacterised protein [Legionella waltersii]HAU3646472.1 hypothetical protein [Legionella pneumophila]HAU3652831.1 hypothetical protein [Legionella pneumophila]